MLEGGSQEAPLHTPRHRLWLTLVISGCLVLWLRLLDGVQGEQPFYYAFDMDFVTALDVLFLRSELLPDHLCHPGLGMNLILTGVAAAASALGQLSAGSLDALGAMLNPLAGLAELTDILRATLPYAVVGTALLLASLVLRISAGSPVLFPVALLVLASAPATIYASKVIRPETFAVLFWSAAAFTAVTAAGQRGLARRLAVVATGLLAALSFFTKVQGVFYLAALPLLYLLAIELAPDAEQKPPPVLSSRRVRLIYLVTAAGILLSFTLASWLAHRTEVPTGLKTWAQGWGVTPLWLAVLLLPVMALVLTCLALWRPGRWAWVDCVAEHLVLALVGATAGMALHLLFFEQASLGGRYLLLDLKMALLRRTDLIALPGLSEIAKTLRALLHRNPAALLAPLLLLAGLGEARRRGLVSVGWRPIILLAGLLVLGLLQIGLASRPGWKDFIWQETLPLLIGMISAALLVTRTSRWRLPLAATSAVVLMILAGMQIESSLRLEDRLQQPGGRTFRQRPWIGGIHEFNANQRLYVRRMREVYRPDMRGPAFAHASLHRERRATARSLLPELKLDHTHIGVLARGFAVQPGKLDTRIHKAPAALAGSMLLALPSPGSARTQRLKLRPRNDLNLLLFVAEESEIGRDVPALQTTEYQVELRGPGGPLLRRGIRVVKPVELSLDTLGAPVFLVVVAAG